MNDQEYRDTRDSRYCWHCCNRYTKFCDKDFCRGTGCRAYRANKNSYHYFKINDPIKGEK